MPDKMNALEFIKSFDHIPMDMLGDKPIKASNSCIRRWLDNRSILINGKKPTSKEEIEFPVNQLIFFPNSKRKCTMQDIT